MFKTHYLSQDHHGSFDILNGHLSITTHLWMYSLIGSVTLFIFLYTSTSATWAPCANNLQIADTETDTQTKIIFNFLSYDRVWCAQTREVRIPFA